MEQNLGSIHTIFLQNVDTLFETKQGKQIIKEYISILKGNKNLLKEYSVFDYIEMQVYSESTKGQITEAIGCLKGVDRGELKEGHLKLIKLLEDNKIVKTEAIENEKLYENIDKLIFTRNVINQLDKKINLVNSIVENIKNNKVVIVEEKQFNGIEVNDQTIKYLVKKFNEKYDGVFDDEQKALFESASSMDENIQSTTFEKTRIECLKLTNDFLKEAIDNDTKEKVLSVKEKLLEDKFSKDTYIEDMINYIKLKETLED